MIRQLAKSSAFFWFIVIVCIAMLAVAVTDVSLWIDEGFIAWAVDHRTPLEMAHALVPPIIPSPADRQYPLYDLWMWMWTRVFGSGEYALRTANLPFAALYVVAIACASRFGFNNRFGWIPFAIAPFAWYYVNEVRPYLMLAAFAACTIGALVVYRFGEEPYRTRAKALLLPALLVTLATHILAILLIPGLIVVLLGGERSPTRLFAAWKIPVLAWSLPFLAVLAFYAITLVGGSGGAEVANNQHRGGTLAAFAAEAGYEQLGFAGLGPSRTALRSGEASAKAYAVPLAGGAIGLVLAVGLALRGGNRRRAAMLATAWLVSFGLAIVVSEILHARFLGRHLAAVFPLFAVAMASMLRTRLQIALVFAVFVVSDLRLTTLAYYGKDDYRAAVFDVIALQHVTGGVIDWAADDLTANYYGLGLAGGRQQTGAIRVGWPVRANGQLVMGVTAPDAVSLVERQLRTGNPVLLALSRPEIFDARGGWEVAIARLHPELVAQYNNFTIYRFGGGAATIRSRFERMYE